VFEQFQSELGEFCEAHFTPVASSEALEEGQSVLVDTGAMDGPRFRRGLIARVIDQ